MRHTIIVAAVAFISTAPFAADLAMMVITPAAAQQEQTSPAPAPSQAVPDKKAVQTVISGQLEAFKSDDDATAYSYAAPNIQRIFPTAGQFMTMVRSAYQPVYRPRSYRFGTLEQTNGRWVQTVELVGPEGDYYTAAYSLEAEADGSWKITGCMIVKAPGTSA